MILPPVAKRLLDSVEIPPDGLEHNFERRRVHWFENAIFETSLLTVDQSRRRGVEFLEQFISASRRGSCPKDPRNWSRAITDRHDILSRCWSDAILLTQSGHPRRAKSRSDDLIVLAVVVVGRRDAA